MYSLTLLTKFILPKLLERSKKNKKSLIINLSSQASLIPTPYFADYAGTKAFNDRLSKGLYYELKPMGIDVLSVKPGVVATSINYMKPSFMRTITVDSCVKGILGNATHQECYGGWVHEIHGFFAKCFIMDLVPFKWQLEGMKRMAAKVKETFKAKS